MTIAEAEYREQADRAIAKRDAELAAVREQNARLRTACQEVADVIQGGDKLASLEPWAQEVVGTLRAALDETKP